MNHHILKPIVFAIAITSLTAAMAACSSYSKNPDGSAAKSEQAALKAEAASAISRFRAQDPSLDKFFNSASGYAVFPKIAKGGAGIGGAYGKGVLYENGAPVGYCSMKQGTIGLQLGGQTFSEIIFLEKPYDVSQFKKGEVEFSAEATAVAASKGAAAKADYANGVAIFILGQQGLMAEAAIGGQSFNYWTD